MPLYSFHCKKCDSDMELLVDANSRPTCSHCGSPRLTRLMSRVPPPGKSRGYAKTMRAQAAREGHLSNYSRSERGR
jgi:putative FmdB family regulatory protein